jgi:superfamily II DNA/RNA helicase
MGWYAMFFFQTYDGDMSWLSGESIITASFSDPLGTGRSRERLRTAISPRGDWLPEVLTAAHDKLMELRTTHPDAGGLVVCQDIRHAIEVARLLQEISKTLVTVVTSENDESTRLIDEFRHGRNEWIVAVKMLSEGVDIKRLRVGVYASNVTTELFFRQVVGRFVRMIDGLEEQYAWLFIPKDPTIAAYAERLREERNHVIEDDKDELLDEIYRQRELDSDRQKHLFSVIHAFAEKDDIIHDASSFSVEELVQAAKISEEIGLPGLNAVVAAKFIRHFKQQGWNVPDLVSPQPKRQRTLEEQKRHYTRRGGIIGIATTRLIEASNGELTYDVIGRELNAAQEVRTRPECTLEQLQERVEIINAWRKSYEDNTWREFTPTRYLREHPRAGA